MESVQAKKLVVVAGGTGKCGYYIVDELLKRGYIVRLITRNRQSAQKMLKQNFEKVSNEIIEIDLSREAQTLEKKILQGQTKSLVEHAFLPGPNGEKVSIFISALGPKNKEKCRDVEYLAVRLLIDLCKQNKVDKFIQITSLGITRPFNPIVYILNQIVDYSFHWKAQAENYLRQSGINYMIVRPGGLKGNQEKSELHDYTLSQNDTFNGTAIHVKTVARVLVEALEDSTLPQKLTFEVTTSSKQQLQKVQQENTWKWNSPKFVADNDKSIVTANHFQAGKIINTVIISVVVCSISFFLRKFLF